MSLRAPKGRSNREIASALSETPFRNEGTSLLLAVVAFLFYAVSGCASSGREFTYFHPAADSQNLVSLEAKVYEIEKREFENIEFETLAQNKLSSHHLVVIRDREPLHYHARHDAWAFVIQGEGDFLLGEAVLRLRPATSVFIPRRIPHQVIRRGKEPMAAFVVFTPSYDGTDFVPVKE